MKHLVRDTGSSTEKEISIGPGDTKAGTLRLGHGWEGQFMVATLSETPIRVI